MGLKDVLAVEITVQNGDIAEIHVVTEGSRSAKNLVRDIESALFAELKRKVDHRKISIAQKKDIPEVPLDRMRHSGLSFETEKVSHSYRVCFEGVNLLVSGNKAHAQVELSLNGLEILGSASGSSSRENSLRLVGDAALQAIEGLIDDDCAFSLGNVEVVRLGSEEVVLVGVRLLCGRTEKVLAGSCVVEEEVQKSVVYAVLDAVNRVFGRLRLKEETEYEVRPASIREAEAKRLV
ncbi:MAG: hypothetical protein QME66_10265 [Candidatus Eisenbacteria bacterium]|nr:hypothetical protein [Candidatus Eisenbacteria bacterium]